MTNSLLTSSLTCSFSNYEKAVSMMWKEKAAYKVILRTEAGFTTCATEKVARQLIAAGYENIYQN